MKILIHIPWGLHNGFVGGTERYAINLARGLRRRGEEAFIVASNLEGKISVEGVDVFGAIPEQFRSRVAKYGYANEHFFKNEIIGNLFSESSIRTFSTYVSLQLKGFDFDVALLHSFVYSCLMNDDGAASRMIVSNFEVPEEMDNYWGRGAFACLRGTVTQRDTFLHHASALVTPSRYYAEFFGSILGRHVIPVPLGIEESAFSGYSKDRQRKEWLFPRGSIVVLLPSRFDIIQKGHDIALQALQGLKQNGYPIKMVFSGYDVDSYGKNRSILEKLLTQYGLHGDVLLTRFDNLMDGFQVCDIVISPERFASYGLAISESLACGIPTVLSPIPSYKEIAGSYRHAHFMHQLDHAALQSEIKKLLDGDLGIDEDESSRFRQNNSFERCVARYHELCKTIH